jgi:hypothetical protein
MHLRRYLPAVFAILLILQSGLAYGLRCGNELVTEGDSRATVLAKCGEPVDRFVYVVEKKVGDSIVNIVVEEWTYNLGPYEFLYFLTFANGKLQEIQTGEYGY